MFRKTLPILLIATLAQGCGNTPEPEQVRNEEDTAVPTPVTPLPVQPTENASPPTSTVVSDQSGDSRTPVTPPPAAAPELRERVRIEAEAAAKHKAQDHVGIAAEGFAQRRSMAPAKSEMYFPAPAPIVDRENYGHYDDNPVHLASREPLSTFSIDVDTGSYANVRRLLSAGRLPPQDAVRTEEMINYFDYGYEGGEDRSVPFAVTMEMGPTPWNKDTRLLHVGIKAWDSKPEALPPANLVFLVDVSGSMRSKDKLELLKTSLKMLTQNIGAEDSIAIVVYAGASGVVLEPTSGKERHRIIAALDRLQAGGSTNGGAGIELAYQTARSAWKKNGINRVILATDGDFNVGTVNFEALKDLIEQKRQSGISLTTLGFGTGNYNDHLMEQLADAGNGNYSYIDTLHEARKVLVEEMSSTLQTVARDVKIQIEFNPALVAEYRLIGYENRVLNKEDFNNDKVDAGDIGAGHTVTAIYEIALSGSKGTLVDPLRYGQNTAIIEREVHSDEIALLKLRYKLPQEQNSKLLKKTIRKGLIKTRLKDTSDDYRFAAAVAGFGQILRGARYTGDYGVTDVIALAGDATGKDSFGYRQEFIRLVSLSQSLAGLHGHNTIERRQ